MLGTNNSLIKVKKLCTPVPLSLLNIPYVSVYLLVMLSIGSKSLYLRKKAGVNSMTYFFKLNDLKEILATFL